MSVIYAFWETLLMPYYPLKTNQVFVVVQIIFMTFTMCIVVLSGMRFFSLRECDEPVLVCTWLCMTMNSGCHMFQFMHQWIFEHVIVGRCVEMFKRFPQHNHQVIKGLQQLLRTTGACVCVCA